MKKSLIIGMVGMAVMTASSFGQGYIVLDNYNTSGPYVTYGPGSGGTVGAGLLSGWTAGIYYAVGDVLSQVGSDPSGVADPGTLGGGLTLATGAGSTVPFYTSAFGVPGCFSSTVPLDVGPNPGDTFTAMVVAYDGASYGASLHRGHSAAFLIDSQAAGAIPPTGLVGFYMSGFSVYSVPEPTTLALGGLGLMALALFRRKDRTP